MKDKKSASAPLLVTIATIAGALAIAGCDATISPGDNVPGPGASPNGSAGGPPGTGTAPGTGGTVASGAAGVVATPFVRLTRAEYVATVKAAFNVVADVSGIPGDGRIGPFTSNAVAIDSAAETMLASEDLAAQIVPSLLPACTGAVASCITTSYQAPLERLFRRPLRADELTRLASAVTSLESAGVSAEAATRGMLVSAFMSADFLFRAMPVGGVPARGRSLAEHLSYAIVDAPPDSALLTAAQGAPESLGSALKEQALRLAADQRAVPVLSRFLSQWLFVDVDLSLEAPEFATSPLYAELLAFVRNALATNLPVKSFVNTTQGFVQKGNFAAYGLTPASSADDVVAVTWASSGRRGLLGEELFMEATRHPDPSRRPIFRGHMIRTSLLCEVIPSPPSNVVELNAEVSDRTTDARCAGCHSLMDPIGKAFAPWDLGNTQGAPAPVVTGSPAFSGNYPDMASLLDAIAGSDAYASCFARNLLAFFLEQSPESIDSGAVREVASVVAAGGGLADALSQVVVSVNQRSLDATPWCTDQ